MLKILLILLNISIYCHAANTDLDQILSQLEHEAEPIKPAAIPVLIHKKVKLEFPLENNVFDSKRDDNLNNNEFSQQMKYSLIQLQMVGYLRYRNIDYALLKTPYEVIKVKIGDHVKNGIVIKITQTMTEINELQLAEKKIFNKKLFFYLNADSSKKVK